MDTYRVPHCNRAIHSLTAFEDAEDGDDDEDHMAPLGPTPRQ